MDEAEPPPAARPHRRRTDRGLVVARIAFVAPAVLYLVLFFAYPVLYNARMSLTDFTTTTFYTGEAPFVGLRNFAEMLDNRVFMTALRNTAIFTLVSIVAQFTIGMLLALFFRKDFPLNRFLRSIMLLPWLLPLIVSATIYRWILDQDSGVANQILRVLGIAESPVPWLTDGDFAMVSVIIANVWVGIPFCLVILHSGMQSIPTEMYEATAIDGANRLQQFRYITWPLLRPVTAVVLTLSLIYTLKTFDIIYVLTHGGPANATQTLATFSYITSFEQFRFGQGAAIGNVLVLISLVFGFWYLRSYRRVMREEAQ